MTGADKKLNLRLSIQMAAPHTWPAALAPALLSGALVLRRTGTVNILLWIVLLLICILMQSAANILNDYYDLLRGTDRPEDNVEVNDAVLVHNQIPPGQALGLGIGTLAAALLLAVYPIMTGGMAVLGVGVAGAAVLLCYSAGPCPLSTLPVGELAAGITMGGFIPLACVIAFTGGVYLITLADSLPVILGIALMMMTNNVCDIERDLRVHRRTLPALLGRSKTRVLYRLLLLVWIGLLAGYMLFRFPLRHPASLPLIGVCILLAVWGAATLRRQFRLDLEPPCRPGAMKGIALLNGQLSLLYILWVLV